MSEQGALFANVNTKAGPVERPTLPGDHPARWSDPDSSHVAITRLRNSGRLANQREQVLHLQKRGAA
jgi:hypothetical protein